jgi:hypothetical protein
MAEDVKVGDKFGKELVKVIDYFRQEFDLSYIEAIGALEILKLNLHQEYLTYNDNDEEFEDEIDGGELL